MKKRYRALRIIGVVARIAAWIVLVLGFVVAFIAGIILAIQAGGVAALAALIGTWVAGAIFVIVSSLLLFAFSELIYISIDIEQNTRATAEQLRQATGAAGTSSEK